MPRLFVTVRWRRYYVKKKEEGLELDLYDTKINCIDEIKGLDKLVSLNKLNLGKNNISEIKGLETLTELKSLILGFNKITRIQGLDTLEKLNHLSLDFNQITKMEGLERLVRLESLYLTNNKLDSIEGIENLSRLRYLKLSNNQITQINGLQSSKRLHLLALDNNKISEIKNLESLVDLRELYLFNNEITEIKGLKQLKELRILSLENDQISEIKGLANQVSMIDFSLYGNPIYEEAKKHFKVVNLLVHCELHRFAHPEQLVKSCQRSSSANENGYRNTRALYSRHRRIMCFGIKVLLFSAVFSFIPWSFNRSNVFGEGLAIWSCFEFYAKLLQRYEIHLNPPIRKLDNYYRITWELLACGIITAACSYIYRFFISPSFEIQGLPFWIIVIIFIGFTLIALIMLTKFSNELERQLVIQKANEKIL